ncbi:helix-turn-helix transcriptional regulator [Castellaniella caeni]|uniref:helix-turn-helix transcriptional regulator n=1 Tax=Castellaniella caeni TaxID=266123 RepID=UPI000C9FD752|nr:AlpA family transcriptional regulator [Castellaniella caeni]
MKALKIKDVVEKVSLGQSTIYKMVAEGGFPRPFQIAPNRVAWVESEVDAWLAERAAVRGREPEEAHPA